MKRLLAIHPFLFAAWSVLFIYAQNVQFASFRQVWIPLGSLLALALALFAASLLILRNVPKAAALVSLFTLLFFSFGRAYTFIWGDGMGYFATPESLMLMLGWVMIFVVGAGLVVWLKSGWPEITQALNLVAFVLVVLSLARTGSYKVQAGNIQNVGLEPPTIPESGVRLTDPLPDIYYVVVDAYARDDILADVYGYDNSEFLSFLTDRGFVVARKSRSNYAQTELSLASSLNVTYLDQLASIIGPETYDRRPLQNMIQHSSVIDFLRRSGYHIVALPSGYSATEIRSAETYVASTRTWNEIETRLLCSTPLPWITLRGTLLDPYAVHRDKILYTLNQLPGTAETPSPRFVFAHVLAPHGPYVLDAEGNAVDPTEPFNLRTDGVLEETGEGRSSYRSGYTGQLAFVTRRLMSIVDELLSRSSRPTVIVLQSDHGPDGNIDWENPDSSDFRERHAILNAYRLPGNGATLLYDEITPVNTFRVILSHYLGADLELLEDRSYFSSWERPYQFTDVTENP